MTAIPPRWRRRVTLALALPGLGLAALGAVVTVGSAPALAADRGVILFQPLAKDNSGLFSGIGAGPFTTTYPDGIKDGGKTLTRGKVTEDNFANTYEWGSDGSEGGMVIKNISDKSICQITISILDNSTFPKDVKLYKAPDKWQVSVSDDAKTLTFSAIKQPGDCMPNGTWFWMQVPKSTQPYDPGGATLKGKLALAGDNTDAVALASIEPDTEATYTDTATDTSTAVDTSTPTDSATSTVTDTPTDSATATDTATSSDPPTPDPSATADQPTPSDSATLNPPVISTTAPAAGAGP